MTLAEPRFPPDDAAKRAGLKPRRAILSAEHARLHEAFSEPVQPWRKWGPYVAERSWATVREDYSPNGTAWNFFTHEMAPWKAYRWGEDAIGGICDRYQLLVFGLALWNGQDAILKERFFGLSNYEGNHGEDAKEYWFYLDNTPTHSYMRMLYKYPQRAFPYEQLVRENARPGRVFEYELLDTGIFDDDRYFDVFIEYAKASPEDLCIRIEAVNRGPEAAELHLIPQVWFRNTWAWSNPPGDEPNIVLGKSGGAPVLIAEDVRSLPLANLPFRYKPGRRYLYGPAGAEALFTNNETRDAEHKYAKDAFHRCIIGGEACVCPDRVGTKAALHSRVTVPAGGTFMLRLRFTDRELARPLDEVDEVIRQRRAEADEFYDTIYAPEASEEERKIQRAALAGMLWSKQIYLFDVDRWLEGDGSALPSPQSRKSIRNTHWRHLNSMRILPVPDRWEYPWFAAWDLAFESVALSLVDIEFAKESLWLLLFEQFQHPNGQIPAYEWEFSDLNPPVHAWACWRVYEIEKQRTGHADVAFLEKCFHKLLINFAWWVNRVDREGNNVFEGGFLGLDNINVVDRSFGLPENAILDQADATGWMAFFCLNLMKIALELSQGNPAYEVLATKFFEHFIYIGAAMKKRGGRDYQLWDEQDGFFYDVLRFPNGDFHKFRVRSMVGLIPLFAVDLLRRSDLKQHKTFLADIEWFIQNRAELVQQACWSIGEGDDTRYVLSAVNPAQFERVLQLLVDPNEFFSEAGVRSLSKYHLEHPYHFGEGFLKYEPAESEEKIKGGNSNWRGPVWFPTSYLLIESLMRFGDALGPQFSVSSPDGGRITPRALAGQLADRMIGLFARNKRGLRPCYGGTDKFQNDPHWRDYLLFHEYFHGDNGAGLGASHQTGWTGLVANLIDEWRR